MLVRALILLAIATVASVRADVVTSQSRQFVVHYSGAAPVVDKIPPGYVEVVPELLPITAERVKRALGGQIPALREGRDQIHLGILDRLSPESPIGVAATRYADAWRYEVAIPRVADEVRLVKALLNVMLLEYANRTGNRSAEIPAWLTEGLTEQLHFTVGPKLVVDRTPDAWEATSRDLNNHTRQVLRTNTAPTFDELTTSAVPAMKSSGEAVYLASAHLLVHSLLELPNGPQRFSNFLQLLPHTWNWQTAFRKAFGFERMLDVEKWWALAVTEFTTRDQRQAWSTSASLQRLSELLTTQVEYHSATNSLPEPRRLDLQSLFEEVDLNVQQQAIREKVSQLASTAPHLAPEIGALALAYKKTLEMHLEQSGKPSPVMVLNARQKRVINDTLRRIADLDAKRKSLAEPTVSSAR